VRVSAWALTITCAAVLLAMTAARAGAAAPCWERVIADWSDNGRVDRAYPLSCYHEAVRHMPEDLRAYSSAPAAIDRALAERRTTGPAPPRTASAPPLVSATRGRGSDLAMLVPLVAGGLAAGGVGWWLVRARRRPTDER